MYDDLYLQTGDFRYRQLRDQQLRAILRDPSSSESLNSSLKKPERKGNSVADLRLSLRGFAFNDWVKANPRASVSETAARLRGLITSDAPLSGSIKRDKFPRPIPR